MSNPTPPATGARGLPQLAWQVSAIPAQILGLHGPERRVLPFLAAVSGTAALGVVDWPVALLIAGGYLLNSRAPRRPLAAEDEAARPPAGLGASQRTQTEPAVKPPNPRPSTPAGSAPLQANGVSPAPDAPAANAGQAVSTAPEQPEQTEQPEQPASAPASQAPPQVSSAAPRPQHRPAGGQPLQKRARPARRSPSSAAAPEPWTGYDQMTVPRVVEHLNKNPNVDLSAVERYEAVNRNRKMVQAAITSRRASQQT